MSNRFEAAAQKATREVIKNGDSLKYAMEELVVNAIK